MENNENKHELVKLLIVGVLSFIGAFLAFYVLMHQTMLLKFSPLNNDIVKFEDNLARDANKMLFLSEKGFKNFKHKISAAHTLKYDDAYVIVIDLKHFNNDENNIRFNVNGNIVTVSGNVVKDHRNKENKYYFMESFEIPEKINMSGIEKEKIDNKYVITLPFEE